MRVIIVHAWHANPQMGWYPSVQYELEKSGIGVRIPTMPDSEPPKLDDWVAHINGAVGEPSEDVILVGHSLGAVAAMRYLETLTDYQRIGGLVMVAGFTESLGLAAVESFFQTPLDFGAIKQCVVEVVAIHSDNDSYVEPDYFKHAFTFMTHLKARVILIPDGGHFSVFDDCFRLPEAVFSVREIAANLQRA